MSEDVPVPGGTVAVARALKIDPVPDRPNFFTELTRVIFGQAAAIEEVVSSIRLARSGLRSASAASRVRPAAW